jgi:O-antigen ligase
MVKASGREWARLTIPLDGRALTGGSWYAPRLAFFSMALESSGRLIEIRNVTVVGPDGRDLIANGDFGKGMARWFFTSDRFHLPWHIKNLGLNVLFDQGVVGLTLFAALVVIALWRLIAGRASGHALAPFLAASLTGFLVVGAFDSLLDAPRAAFLFYLLLLASLALREPPQAAGTPAFTHTRQA